MARLVTGGPEFPSGRRARSTRKTKPSSVTSPISAYSPRATCEKYSCALVAFSPSVVPVFLVEIDEVDVRRHVQLARAELAHADDPEVDAAPAPVAGHAEAPVLRGQDLGQGQLERGLGEVGHGPGDVVEAGAVLDVEHRQALEDQLTADAQGARQRPAAACLQLSTRAMMLSRPGSPVGSAARSSAYRRRMRCTKRLCAARAGTCRAPGVA
jgi:hypothetical protein